MKKGIQLLGALISVAACIAFVVFASRTLDAGEISSRISAGTAASLGAAALLCSTAPPIGVFAWKRILASLGYRTDTMTLSAIVLTTQAGKYLPGNIAHHVGRTGLSMALGIPAHLVVISIAYELPLILLTSLAIGIVMAFASPQGAGLIASQHHGLLTVICVVAVLLLGLPFALRQMPKLALLFRGHRGMTMPASPMSVSDMAKVVAINSIAYLMSGAALYVLASSLLPEIDAGYPLLTAAFAIAWTVGFVTPGSPAGIGIRETLLVLMLSGPMGSGSASILALWLRIATTLGDLLAFAAGAILLWHARRHHKKLKGETNHGA